MRLLDFESYVYGATFDNVKKVVVVIFMHNRTALVQLLDFDRDEGIACESLRPGLEERGTPKEANLVILQFIQTPPHIL